MLLGIWVELSLELVRYGRDILGHEVLLLLSAHEHKFVKCFLKSLDLGSLLCFYLLYFFHLFRKKVEHLFKEIYIVSRWGALKIGRRRKHSIHAWIHRLRHHIGSIAWGWWIRRLNHTGHKLWVVDTLIANRKMHRFILWFLKVLFRLNLNIFLTSRGFHDVILWWWILSLGFLFFL